jgi:hypothetical protein
MTDAASHVRLGPGRPRQFGENGAALLDANRMAIWTDIGKSTAPMVKQLHEYWMSKRGGAVIPDRSLIDPAEMKPLLPNILIAEPSHPPFRVRYRLVGSRVAAASGLDITGRYLDEMIAADDVPWQACYQRVWSERIPLYGDVTVATLHGDQFGYEFAIFPLSRGGESVEQFIAIEDYGGREIRLRQFEDKLPPWQPMDKPPG